MPCASGTLVALGKTGSGKQEAECYVACCGDRTSASQFVESIEKSGSPTSRGEAGHRRVGAMSTLNRAHAAQDHQRMRNVECQGSESTYVAQARVFGGQAHGNRKGSPRISDRACITDFGGVWARGAHR